MKPTKNRVFCMGSQKAKILFDSREKALNFIKFNRDEMLGETGIAPKRAYFCKCCAGWHVSSHLQPVSKRGKVKKLISIAYDNMTNSRFGSAKRFLIYAKDQLAMVKETMQESPFDEKLTTSINKATGRLVSLVMKLTTEQSPSPMPVNIEYHDLVHDRCELDVVNITEDEENEGVIIDIRPQLLYHGDGKYYYALYGRRLTPDELRRTNELNGFTKEDENIQMLTLHKFNMVQVKGTDSPDQNKQYASLEEFIDGDIIYSKKFGMKLLVLEKTGKAGHMKYWKRSHLDFWIRLMNHNVHFFSGKCNKYVCYVTTEEIRDDTIIRLFRKRTIFK